MDNKKEEVLNWLLDGEVGVSSEAIANRVVGKLVGAFDTPCDAGDFGRCYKMLKACPSVDIKCMKGFNRIWDNLVDAWSELTSLYEDEQWREIYDKIDSCSKPFRVDGRTMAKDIVY